MAIAIGIFALLCIIVLIWAVVTAPTIEATEEEKVAIREMLNSQNDLSP